jgi:50S ribosomal protein L16 3-hydroxylase
VVLDFFDRLKLNLNSKGQSVLDELIAPHSVDYFIQNHLHQPTPLIVEGDLARWRFLGGVFPFKNVTELLRNWTGIVDVMSNTKDGMRTVGMLADQAEKLWQEKVFTLMFHNVHSQFPALATVMDELRKSLGVPRNLISIPTAYASPAGCGLSWHYDVTANFMLQIAGEKTWYLAPNHAVDTPTVAHILGKPVSPECDEQLHAPMPNEGFDNPQIVRMKPGSLMYIPPGYWHKTEAQGESFALSCSFNRPSWAQLVGDSVQRLLSRHSQWRQMAYGAGAENMKLNSLASEHLGSLLDQLPKDLGELTVQNIFESIPSNSNVFSPTANSVDLTRNWVEVLSRKDVRH